MTSNVTELLYAASDHAPPSRLDLPAAVRTGRRRRRRRRLVAVLAAAVGLAVAGGVIAAVGRPAGTPPPVAAPPAARAFDPLVSTLTLTYGETEAIRHAVTVDARSETIELVLTRGGVGQGGIVTLYATGILPWEEPPSAYWFRVSDPQGSNRVRFTTEPAPPVGGRPAQWLIYTGRTQGLAWQWAPYTWAVAYTLGAPGADWRPELLELATAVRTDASVPLRFPYTLVVPDGWQHVVSQVGNLGYSVGFNRSGRPQPGPPYDLVEQADLSMTLVPGSVQGDAYPTTPNDTVGGFPAIVSTDVDGDYSVTLLDVQGYRVTVTVRAEALADFPPEYANDLALDVTILGPPEDESQWTTNPLR